MTNEALMQEVKLCLVMTWRDEKSMTWHWAAGRWAVQAARLGWVSAAWVTFEVLQSLQDFGA